MCQQYECHLSGICLRGDGAVVSCRLLSLCIGIRPVFEQVFDSTSHYSVLFSFAAMVQWCLAAHCLCALASAPCSSRYSTVSTLYFCSFTAWCSGVLPHVVTCSIGIRPVCRAGSSDSIHIGTPAAFTAWCRGVSPFSPVALASAPCFE